MMIRGTCPQCGAQRTVEWGQEFPGHVDQRFARQGRFRWCMYGNLQPIIEHPVGQ